MTKENSVENKVLTPVFFKSMKAMNPLMFSWRSHKENAQLTERFSISEYRRLIQDLPGIHRLVKLTVNEGFLAV